MNAQQSEDEKYMRRALQLARGGREHAAPNPMVGAVVVVDGRIIGEGYHRRCGGSHAEVNAIRMAQERGAEFGDSTIYVTLEPCAHYGKTPPCAQLIIDTGIPRVVVGCRDPFAKVDGLGIKMLRDAGIDVTVGVLEDECIALNRRFMTFHSLRRPFVTLKWAQSSDGYIDRRREEGDGQKPVIFSNPRTQQICHRRRAEHDAIVVGWRTNRLDRPSLTTRLWPGDNPLRIVMERQSPQELLDSLFAQGVQSVLVEGGAHTLQAFIDAGLWDEAYVETAPWCLHDGVKAPVLSHFEAI